MKDKPWDKFQIFREKDKVLRPLMSANEIRYNDLDFIKRLYKKEKLRLEKEITVSKNKQMKRLRELGMKSDDFKMWYI